jgi:hypothetical protein
VPSSRESLRGDLTAERTQWRTGVADSAEQVGVLTGEAEQAD